jgi:alpha-beta hydrolase superfamily lysophospholipase
LGHSMGSFAVRLYTHIDFPGTVDGSPPFRHRTGTGAPGGGGPAAVRLHAGIRAPGTSAGSSRPLPGGTNLHFRPNRTTVDWISRDNCGGDAYAADTHVPLVPTGGHVHEMSGGPAIHRPPGKPAEDGPSTPVYLFSGDRDPVGSNGMGVQKVYGFFQKAGTRDLRMKLLPRRTA